MYNLNMKKIYLLVFIILITTGAGYEGKLPDLEADMSYKIKYETIQNTPFKKQKDSVIKETDLKKVPTENKEYVDIIIKKDRTPEYFKDIQPVIELLEKFKNYIEDDVNTQMFNACANSYIDYASYIQLKYKNRHERYYASYRAITGIIEDTRNAAQLRAEAAEYKKFLPYSGAGEKYTKQNLDESSKILLKKIYDTLYVLKNLD